MDQDTRRNILADGERDMVGRSGVLDVDLEVREEHQGLAAILAVINIVVHASERVSYFITDKFENEYVTPCLYLPATVQSKKKKLPSTADFWLAFMIDMKVPTPVFLTRLRARPAACSRVSPIAATLSPWQGAAGAGRAIAVADNRASENVTASVRRDNITFRMRMK
jgi:hypothetical protein